MTLKQSHLGQKQITVSETFLDYCYPHAPQEGEKTLSAPALMERERTPCLKSLQERKQTSCVQSLQEREKTPRIKADLPVGGRLKAFSYPVGKTRNHQSILSLLRDGYRLPFRECLNLFRVPCITSGYTGSDTQSALLTSIQDLLLKGAIEVMNTQNRLGF